MEMVRDGKRRRRTMKEQYNEEKKGENGRCIILSVWSTIGFVIPLDSTVYKNCVSYTTDMSLAPQS